MSGTFKIGAKRVGPGAPAFIIAEVAQAHEGSLGLAHSFIDAAASAGADAVKFQSHIASAESTLDEPFRVRFTSQDATRYDYWRRMEFSAVQWAELANHAAEKKLVFLSSAFSIEAIELLTGLGMAAWKVASGEVDSYPLLDAMAATGAPFIVSTGMSPWSEIAAIADYVQGKGRGLALLQCTSKYPTTLEQIGLNVIGELRRRFNCPAGLSDHSGSVFPPLAALAQGADVLEVHLAFDRSMFGPDAKASLTVAELRQVVAARDAFAAIAVHPVDKDAAAADAAPMRSLFMRSVAPVRELPAGAVLTRDMLALKKPGTGIPAADLPKLVGQKLKRDVLPNRLLKWDDIGD